MSARGDFTYRHKTYTAGLLLLTSWLIPIFAFCVFCKLRNAMQTAVQIGYEEKHEGSLNKEQKFFHENQSMPST